MPKEFTVPQAVAFFSVSADTVRRNIRSQRLNALRRGLYRTMSRGHCEQLRSKDLPDTTVTLREPDK